MGKYDVDVGTGIVAKTVQKSEEIKASLTTRASKSIDGIMLAVVCLLEILLAFVSISFSKTFTLMDAICTFSESAVTIVVFYMFIQSGKNGRCGIREYVTVYDEWKAVCKHLRENGLLRAFRSYCERCSKADAQRLKEAEIERLENLYVTREAYEGTDEQPGYRSMSTRELKKLRKKGVFSKAAYKQILRCNEPGETIPYNAHLILDGAEDKHIQRGLKTGDHYEAIGVALKPVTCFLVTVVTKILQIAKDDVRDPVAVIVSVLFTIFSICFAAFMGYKFGWNCMAREQRYMEARTAFINRFKEEQEKSPA